MAVKDRIHRIGIELEGGWHAPVATWKGDSFPVQRDGSVHFEPDPALVEAQRQVQLFQHKIVNASSIGKRSEFEIAYAKAMAELQKLKPPVPGEIPSPPLDRGEVESFMRACYPPLVNATCGLHVHMSFMRKLRDGTIRPSLLNYQRLMTPDFTVAMVKALREWGEEEKLGKDHPLWARVNNPQHEHCSHQYCGDAQAKMTKKDYQSRGKPWSRYTAMNYCLKQHKTVECRLLCMMETVDQGIRAVSRVLDTTNTFLSKVREKEMKARVFVSPSVGSIERREIYV